jgi:hypothetical protein
VVDGAHAAAQRAVPGELRDERCEITRSKGAGSGLLVDGLPASASTTASKRAGATIAVVRNAVCAFCNRTRHWFPDEQPQEA